MKISNKEKKLISEKNAKLESVKEVLKTEFIGLDVVIDNVIDNIRPYYIFPKSLKRPLVINLFGMTATGKTDLIQRMITLIGLENKYVRFDVGEYANAHAFKLKEDFTQKLCKKQDNSMVIVFDEIQFGRTISEKGEEINRDSLRSMWELIDSGVLTMSNRFDSRILDYFEFLKSVDFTLFDNKLKCKSSDISSVIFNSLQEIGCSSIYSYDVDKCYITSLFMSEQHEIEKNFPECIDDKWVDLNLLRSKFSKIFELLSPSQGIDGLSIITKKIFKKMCVINSKLSSNYTYESYLEYLASLKTKENIIEGLFSSIVIGESSITYDFSKSLIFVIGNIDEAYNMTHSSNPDADADIFHEHSLKITQPKIKDALAKRFRMEQIGRLGNNIIIYPSFSCDSYKKIIKKLLQTRIDYFNKEFKIKLSFDNKLEDILYKESVFPSQGVRPLLSSITTFIDSYVSKIISDIILKGINTDNIIWSFDYDKVNHEIIIGTKSGNIKLFYPVTLKIENLRKSDYSENQSYTAIHESGHALVSIIKAKLIPKLIVSKSASVAEGFCRIELTDIKTKETEYLNILIALGGRAAEKFVLKNEDMLSTGSYSDLMSATQTANMMVKAYGHGGNSFIIKHNKDEIISFHSESLLLDAEELSIQIIQKAEREVDQLMYANKDLLIELIDYLSNNSQITDVEIKKIVKRFNIEVKDKNKYYNIKERILEFKKENL